MTDRRVLYLQFSNPAGYPPVMHSARILADQGCSIVMLGVLVAGHSLTVASHPRITVRCLPAATGWRVKLRYLVFAMWAIGWTLAWRPHWLYASDPMAAPITRWLQRLGRGRVIYHEHDVPSEAERLDTATPFMRRVLNARRTLVRHADLCVVPSAGRTVALDPHREARRVEVVWNCPARAEAETPRPTARQAGPLRVLFQGSVVPARLPVSVVDAIARVPDAQLVVIGYETAGHPGYVRELLARAQALGVTDRVTHMPAVPRHDLLRHSSTCDVGLALFPVEGTDVNESSMVGASNKPFEYLACGLPIIVANRPEWIETFVEAGFARGCDPSQPDSVAGAIRWYLDHPDERRAMGEAGRRRVATAWNYEQCFEPVERTILGDFALPAAVTGPPASEVSRR